MRKIAITGVLAAVVLAVAPASAADYSALTSTAAYGQVNYGQPVNHFAQVQHTVEPQFADVGGGGGCAAGVCSGCSDGSCGNASCKEGVCFPHRTPDLPGSSLRQYWRSSACNTGAWDGYRKSCCQGSRLGQNLRNGGCSGGDCGPAIEPTPVCASKACDVQVAAPAVNFEVPAACDVPAFPAACDTPGGCDATF